MMRILNDIDRLIAYPFQLRGNAGRHKQEANIPPDRLLQRRQLDGAVIDFDLKIVDLLFFSVNLVAKRFIALDQNSKRGLHHGFRQSAHQEQPFEQILYFFIKVAH